jgi:plasmid stabilization system protein ParE
MEPGKRELAVRFTSTAQSDLGKIWIRNASRYSEKWADDYIDFLKQFALELGSKCTSGEVVPHRNGLKFIVCRKSKRRQAHGHVLVFRVTEVEIQILHVFHTAESWIVKF